MDFLDPQKQKRHAIRLAIGYAIIGLVLVLATTILLYQAYGFGIDRNGKVIQNGLVFVTSQPNGADIYLNGKRYKDRTNTRVTTPAGQYIAEVQKSGYRTWKRVITVEGGFVERFDYTFLFPTKLATAVTKQYDTVPVLATQSADKRWLLVGAETPNSFDLFDLNADKPAAKVVSISDDILAAGSTTTGWQTVEWAGDDRHVILKRTYQKNATEGSEYILFDRQAPEQSQNLSVLLGFAPTKIEMRGHNYDQYFAYDQNSGELFTATLKKPTPQAYIDKVLNFETDGNTVLYATEQGAPTGKALIRMRSKDDPAYTLREVPSGSSYLLALASYNGNPIVGAGAASEDKVYVYRDPLVQLRDDSKPTLVPIEILKVANPTYLSLSPNARFIMAENSDHIAIYDVETDKGYAYQAKTTPDAPQTHAVWMDGFRLSYVSAGRLAVFDFDGANPQALSPASPNYLPFFAPDYKNYYTVNAQNALTTTALRVK